MLTNLITLATDLQEFSSNQLFLFLLTKHKVQKSDLCAVMYTSATTGDPKGVMLTNESLRTMILGMDGIVQTVNQEGLGADFIESNERHFSSTPQCAIWTRGGNVSSCTQPMVRERK